MSKGISEVFDVQPYERKTPIAPTPEIGNELRSDLDYVSANIRQLIEIGLESVKSASNVAEDSESPRAYEVLSTMIKNLTDMNLQLIQVHEKKQSLQTQNQTTAGASTGSNVTNNAIFVGTTKELNDLIMKRISKNV